MGIRMDNLENIDQLFRDELYDFSPQPPKDGWKRLQGELTKSKKVVLFPLWARVAASILLIAGGAAIGWKYFTRSEADMQVLSEESLVPAQIPTESIAESQLPVMNEVSEKSSEVKATVDEEPTLADADASIVPAEAAEPEAEVVTPLIAASEEEEESVSADEAVILPDEEMAEMGDQLPIRESQPELPNTEPVTEDSETIPKNDPKIKLDDIIMQQNLLALEENESEKHKTSWTIGGIAGPQYTYRDVNVNAMPYPIDDYDEYESGVTTYAGGFQIEVEPARRFSVQSGVFYSKIGQVKNSIQVNAGIGEPWISGPDQFENRVISGEELPTDLVNSTGNISFDKSLPPPVAASDENLEWTVGDYTAEQYFEFIEVPIIFKYKLIDRKFDVNISSGLWANFLIGNEAMATDNESFKTRGKTNDINTFTYSGSLSLGFGYPISKRLALSLEPFFKYYLKSINSNPQTDVYPYSMGIMSGVRYTF